VLGREILTVFLLLTLTNIFYDHSEEPQMTLTLDDNQMQVVIIALDEAVKNLRARAEAVQNVPYKSPDQFKEKNSTASKLFDQSNTARDLAVMFCELPDNQIIFERERREKLPLAQTSTLTNDQLHTIVDALKIAVRAYADQAKRHDKEANDQDTSEACRSQSRADKQSCWNACKAAKALRITLERIADRIHYVRCEPLAHWYEDLNQAQRMLWDLEHALYANNKEGIQTILDGILAAAKARQERFERKRA